MSTAAGVTAPIARELRTICAEQYVIDDPAELAKSRLQPVASGVAVYPGTSDEIAAILSVANQEGLRVLPAGGCTLQFAGLPSEADILLYTTRLTDLEHYDPADLTIGIGAGITVAKLSEKVAADHLFFALDPPYPELCTVGGALATAAQGPLRHGYGGLRDYCIGVRFVTGDARKAKGGGRVVKNVAGYDMMKLLIGSRGTLAIITSASFKLFPAPRQTRTFLAAFNSAAEALKFRDIVLRSPLSPMCLELVSPGACNLMTMDDLPQGWLICVRATGSDAVLARYRSELGSVVTRELQGDEETALWRAIENFPQLQEGRPLSPLLSIDVPLSEVGDVIGLLNGLAIPGAIDIGMVGRVGVGHLLVSIRRANPELNHESELAVVDKLVKGLSSQASVTMRNGPHPRGFWPLTPTNLESMRTVKHALDPRDILNRGRFPF